MQILKTMIFQISSEKEENLRNVQDLIGHKNIKTTERLTYVTKNVLNKIKNPLHRLNLKAE